MLELFALTNPQATPTRALRDLEGHRSTPQQIVLADGGSDTGSERITLADDQPDHFDLKVTIPLHVWTDKMEREFQRLAKRYACEEATTDDHLRLHHLQEIRRRLKHPRTAAEIAWEHKQRRVTNDLLAALQAYARLHSPENNPWTYAKENVHE